MLRTAQQITVALTPSVGAPTVLPIALTYQTQSNWCWAACIEMVRGYDNRNPPRSQCDLANTAFGLASCCSSPSSSACNRPLPVALVSAEWGRYGYGATYSASHLPWQRTHNNIFNRRPIEIGLSWTGGGGHAILIVGTDNIGGAEWLVVHDPTRGVRTVTQQNLQAAYGQGTWRWSWDNIA